MNCPLCAATVQQDAADCHSCGVIFSKLRAKREREKKDAEAAVAAPEDGDEAAPPLDPRLTPWRLRGAAAALVALWMLSFGLYYRALVLKMPHSKVTRLHSSAPGGRIDGVELHVSPSTPKPESSSRAEPPPPPGAPSRNPDFDD